MPRALPTLARPRWCVILTTTVHVNVDLRQRRWGHEQQRDATERRAMYARVLSHWFIHLPGVPITIVENSGDSLGWAVGTARQLNRSSDLALVKLRGYADECRKSTQFAEIGCAEAHSIHTAIARSPHYTRPKTTGVRGPSTGGITRRAVGDGGPVAPPRCTHALTVTGRYAIKDDMNQVRHNDTRRPSRRCCGVIYIKSVVHAGARAMRSTLEPRRSKPKLAGGQQAPPQLQPGALAQRLQMAAGV